jgi:hypothetical protein
MKVWCTASECYLFTVMYYIRYISLNFYFMTSYIECASKIYIIISVPLSGKAWESLIKTHIATKIWSPTGLHIILTPLVHIRQVSVSYPGWETGFRDWGFPWPFSVPLGEYRDSNLKIRPWLFLSNSFTIHHSRNTLSFRLYGPNYWEAS